MRTLGVVVVAAMALLLSTGTGCSLRAKIRESERKFALSNVRTWHDHGDWEECVASSDRAQATPDLEPDVAVETTMLKARCLQKLDRKAEALAHYRLLRDFLLGASDKDIALPPRIESRLMGEPGLEAVKASPYNQSLLTLELPGARFTEAAKWSDISGGAIVQWTITKQGTSRGIRVLNDVHPLLAGLAIEAAASATLDTVKTHQDLLPLTKRVMFRFGEQ